MNKLETGNWKLILKESNDPLTDFEAEKKGHFLNNNYKKKRENDHGKNDLKTDFECIRRLIILLNLYWNIYKKWKYIACCVTYFK